MVREFSLAHLTLLSCAPPELTEVAAQAGYQYVSLRPIAVTPNEPKYPLGDDKEMLRRTKRKMADTGVRLLDIELARITPDVDVKSYEPAMAAAAELRGRFLLCSGWTPNKSYTLEKLVELCELAEPYGLTVCFEFVTFSSVSNLAQAAALVEAANRKNCALCIDTLHFFRSGDRVEKLDELPKHLFPYLQICDGPSAAPPTTEGLIYAARFDRQFVGEGSLPIASILHRIPEVPYSIETPNVALSLRLSPVEFARRALHCANRYLDANPEGGKNFPNCARETAPPHD